MSGTIRLLGAARTVTGSRFLIETAKARVLVDCGLFQGRKELRLRNWAPFPVPADTIDSILITHAHLDHVGFLPRIVKEGFSGRVYATGDTAKLAGVVLADSARIQMADAERANRKGYTKHKPALPLYDERDVEEALGLFRPVEYLEKVDVADGVSATFNRAGHILGSATIVVDFDDGTGSVSFSGDLGRPFHPVLLPPDPPGAAGTIVIESTYGDEEHVEEDGTAAIGQVIAATVERGGAVVIPAFAVDRTELILHSLRSLTLSGAIPPIPVFLDSPMARAALGFYVRAVAEGHPEIRPEVAGRPEIFDPGNLTITESVEDSKAINDVVGPHVIISASGMATGGRVLHHLRRLLPDSRNAVILVGYQAVGTRGQSLLAGVDRLKMFGEWIPVRASIHSVPAFSVHADRSELLDWLATAPTPPDRVVAVHGDPQASDSLTAAIREKFGWAAVAPADGDVISLD